MPGEFPTRSALAYQQLMGRWSEVLAARVLDGLPAPLTGEVLDVGCGTGSLIAQLVKEAKITRIAGIDYSAFYVDFARERFQADSRVTVESGDACSLPFPDESFDSVFSLLVLKFVSDPALAGSEMRRMTRPGGLVCAAVWDVYGGFPTNRMFWDTAAVTVPATAAFRATHFALPLTRPGELAAAWARAGLDQIHEHEVVIRMEYANFADYWSPLEAGEGPGGQCVASLSEGERDVLRTALRSAYESGRRDGPRSFAAVALVCIGIAP